MKAEDVPPDGAMHPIDIDDRDRQAVRNREPDTIVGRHGPVVGAMTLHVPGVTDRADAVRAAHRVVVDMPRDDVAPGPLCGVEHVDDVGIWETPHSTRDALRREIARLGRLHRRPVVIVHGYQHVGPCPTGHDTSDTPPHREDHR